MCVDPRYSIKSYWSTLPHLYTPWYGLATKGAGREQITVNCAGSASGKSLPPYVVYKGKNLYESWTTDGQDASYTTNEKG